VEAVVAVIFEYVGLLQRGGGVSGDIFEECRALAELRFNFQDKMQPYAAAQALASSMQVYPERCAKR
jgi:secreted Zn-dependent insulinase-like peptidase